MRKLLVVLLAVALVAGLAALAGCGGVKVSVDEKNGKVQVSTPKGNASVSTKQLTEADLGIPIYPGAKTDENSSLSISGQPGTTQGGVSVAVMWTPDPVSKVISWYKEKLAGKPEFQAQFSTDTEALFTFKDGNNIKLVTIGQDTIDHPGETKIGVSSSATTGGSSPNGTTPGE